MNYPLDFTISQVYSVKRSEYDFIARVYVDDDVYAERRWSHPNPAVLMGMCMAFLSYCDVSLYGIPVNREFQVTDNGDVQLTMFDDFIEP